MIYIKQIITDITLLINLFYRTLKIVLFNHINFFLFPLFFLNGKSKHCKITIRGVI